MEIIEVILVRIDYGKRNSFLKKKRKYIYAKKYYEDISIIKPIDLNWIINNEKKKHFKEFMIKLNIFI